MVCTRTEQAQCEPSVVRRKHDVRCGRVGMVRAHGARVEERLERVVCHARSGGGARGCAARGTAGGRAALGVAQTAGVVPAQWQRRWQLSAVRPVRGHTPAPALLRELQERGVKARRQRHAVHGRGHSEKRADLATLGSVS